MVITYWLHRAVTFFLLAACHLWSPVDTLNKLATADDVTVVASVPYDSGPYHTADIYIPKALERPAPVVVYFYGSAWFTGSKDWYRFIGIGLAQTGVIVIMPDYRGYPDAPSPGFMYDAAAATAWALDHAESYGGDPRKLFIAGHSSGAHIATLLALDTRYLQSVGMSQGELCGVIGLGGSYDYDAPRSVPRYLNEYVRVFGEPDRWAPVQPIRYVTRNAPPMLLLAGEADGGIDPDHTIRLAERLSYAGDKATAILYPGINHQGIILPLSRTLDFLAPVKRDIGRFIADRGTQCTR
jgi:acetyl esterase/lipase